MENSKKKDEKTIKSELKNNEGVEKKSRRTKGTVKISPVTATLVSAFFMWNVTEFGENREENDVTKLADWMKRNPKIDEQDYTERLKTLAGYSAQCMSLADVIENNFLKPELEQVIFLAYFFVRQFEEQSGKLINKGEVIEFNQKVFRRLFDIYDNTALFRKHYKTLYRIKGNDDKHKYEWQRKTEIKVQDKYRKTLKQWNIRQEKVAPKLYSQTVEIIERTFQAVQEIKNVTK